MGSGPRPPRVADVVRTLLAIGAILPGLAAGVAALVRSGERRRALNRAIDLWGRQGTRAAGIRLAVQGGEHLEARPAVFLINHQSGVDPILVCALLRRDFVGVAKREIRRNPVLGPAFAFADTVFIDRGDREQAVEALRAVEDTLRRGVSVLVAPEGTRSPGAQLGPFKKGAFRLALAARARLVPIVLHDAHRVLPRGGWIMRAGTVHVSVLPPIPTADWRLEDLDAHIARVESLYRRALADDGRD